MKNLVALLVLVVGSFVGGGCGDRVKYSSPGLYDLFQPFGQPMYERDSDSVTIRLSPEGAAMPRDVQVQNIRLPENSDVHISGPIWVAKRAQMQVIVQGVSTMNHDQPVVFDILQNGVVRQTVTITVSAPPDVVVKVNGRPVSALQPA